MAEIKKLQVDGSDIYPVTHESAVYDNEGKSIESKYLSSVAYTEGDDIKIEGSEGGSVDTSELEAQIEEVDTKVGELSNLQTTDKDNIVDAINELFQDVDSGKQLIADAIDEESITKDSTFQAMSDKITEIKNNSGGLDIISATELPATGKENQICIISEHTGSPILVTTNLNEITNNPTHVIFLGNQDSCIVHLGTQAQIGNMMYYFNRVMLGAERLPSYIWSNNQWNQLTQQYVPFLEQGKIVDSNISGDLALGDYCIQTTIDGVYCIKINGNASYHRGFSFKNLIDFTSFSRVEVTLWGTNTTKDVAMYLIAMFNSVSIDNSSWSDVANYNMAQTLPSGGPLTTLTYDISSWSGSYYLGFACPKVLFNAYVTEIRVY